MPVNLTNRLLTAINQAGSLLAGGQIEPIKLILETRSLVREFSHDKDANDRCHKLAALIVTCFVEACISPDRSLEHKACLKLCRQSRDDLQRLQPHENEAMRTLWKIGERADELTIMSVRMTTPERSVKTLRNTAFAESLEGYFNRLVEPATSEVKADESVKYAWNVLDWEAQEWCGDYWTKTGPR